MYRENIYEVISGTGEKVNTLVVSTNRRLKAYTWKVLREAGLAIDDAVQVAEDQLRVNQKDRYRLRGGLNLLLRRGEDIPQIVVDYAKKGEVALGITGDDLYDEYRLKNPKNPLRVENTYDWFDEAAKYLRPALCFVNRTGSIEGIPSPRVAIGAKYPKTSWNYLLRSPLTREFEFGAEFCDLVRIYEGSVERKIAEGEADCAIDIVYSGDTIKELGLTVIEIVRFSDLAVISPLKDGPTLEARARRSG